MSSRGVGVTSLCHLGHRGGRLRDVTVRRPGSASLRARHVHGTPIAPDASSCRAACRGMVRRAAFGCRCQPLRDPPPGVARGSVRRCWSSCSSTSRENRPCTPLSTGRGVGPWGGSASCPAQKEASLQLSWSLESAGPNRRKGPTARYDESALAAKSSTGSRRADPLRSARSSTSTAPSTRNMAAVLRTPWAISPISRPAGWSMGRRRCGWRRSGRRSTSGRRYGSLLRAERGSSKPHPRFPYRGGASRRCRPCGGNGSWFPSA